MPQTVLVYRDLVGAKSEAFVQRQYCAFKALKPLYVGTRRGPAAPADALILAWPGWLGAAARVRFRQLGRVPARLESAIDESRPVLIHAQFGLGGALALPVARRAGLPLAVTFHGGDATKDKHWETRPGLGTIFQRRRDALAAEAKIIFCVSRFIRDTLIRRGYPEEKLETHYLGIEIPKEHVIPPPAGVSRTILFVGRLVEKKGLDTLIEAMAAARRAARDLDLAVIGDGPLRKALEQRARALGVPARFEGWQEPREVQKAMRRALALAVPSRQAAGGDAEGLPTVIMEAMAIGLPVVASRHAGIPELVSDGVSGLLVPEADAAALAQAIGALAGDPELAGRLRGEAYADIRARFDARQQSALLERRLLAIAHSPARG